MIDDIRYATSSPTGAPQGSTGTVFCFCWRVGSPPPHGILPRVLCLPVFSFQTVFLYIPYARASLPTSAHGHTHAGITCKSFSISTRAKKVSNEGTSWSWWVVGRSSPASLRCRCGCSLSIRSLLYSSPIFRGRSQGRRGEKCYCCISVVTVSHHCM